MTAIGLRGSDRWEHFVDGEQVELGQAGEQPGVGAVAAADGQLVQQARHADVARGEAAAARPFDEGTAEETLPDAARPGDDQVVAFGDPRAGAQREDLLAIELPGAGEVDGFERRRVAQLGRLQAPLELALLAGRPLGIDQQAEPLLEAERGGLVGVELLLEGVGHRAELRKRLG